MKMETPDIKKILDSIPHMGEVTKIERVYTVALDAGHYLLTEGKCTPSYMEPANLPEWWLNNRVAAKVEAILGKVPQIATLRTDDPTGQTETSLAARATKANEAFSDLVVSIHHNLGIKGGNGGGITAYSFPRSEAGKAWRDDLYAALIDATGLKGNRAQPLQTADFAILRMTDAPAVLLELGFMDSATDLPIIIKEDYADKCAKAICDVILKRFGIEEPFDNNVAPAPAEEIVYNSMDELPEWALSEVTHLINIGLLAGTRTDKLNLDLSPDLLRAVVLIGRVLTFLGE